MKRLRRLRAREPLYVLVACEESQRVCIEFRKLGHIAFSCDLEPCSGGHPEWHIQGDVLKLLGKGFFRTQDKGVNDDFYTMGRVIPKWDLILAFPPCTDLAVSGARYFDKKRADGSQARSIEFFMQFANADCEHVLIENPVGIMSTYWRKPDQIIQPYMFGDPHKKTTCLWLKGLPKLVPSNEVQVEDLVTYTKHDKKYTFSSWMVKGGRKNRQKLRSKTFYGIAKAIALQYSDYLTKIK